MGTKPETADRAKGPYGCAGPLSYSDVNSGDGAAVDADTDQTTRELVHDHEYPIAPEHDRLAAKQVHAPEAILGVADERQPRGSAAARRRPIVFRQDAVHHVPVDIDSERLRMMRAIRGQPNRGLRTLSSTIALMSASSGPFGPGFFGHGLEENSRRYLRSTNA
jgi:hypothetical protein